MKKINLHSISLCIALPLIIIAVFVINHGHLAVSGLLLITFFGLLALGFSGYESDGSLSIDCASDITDYNADNTTDYDLTHDNKSCVLMIDIYTVH